VILLVDIGNSRVKWALLDAGALAPQRAAAYAQWSADDWRRELFTNPGIRRAVVASVAGTESIERLRAAASAHPGCEVRVVTTSGAAGGVRNAYPEPRLLGIDRWLAVIAAHHLTGAACCVVDVGTAATIDAVTADGRHLGGFIVPGPRLMVASLLRGTSDLESHSAASASDGNSLFANNTRDAIERGAVVALASLAERSVQDLERITGAVSNLLVTGGAAPLVLPHLRRDARHVPDLVLRGLAVLAEDGH
jgi:type III pantothenate kinase